MWEKLVMRKTRYLLFVLSVVVFSAVRAQTFDTLRVQGALFATPFDTEPRYVDTLMLVLSEPRAGTAGPIPEIIRKYADLMGVAPTALKDEKIYRFVDHWLGTPYRYGGETKRGIDCSALTRALHTEVSQVLLPRSSRAMYASEMIESFRETDFSKLREGDLLFFRSRGRINHVAVYLCEGKFLSANRSRGVQISDLNDPYWRKRFYSVGRLKDRQDEFPPQQPDENGGSGQGGK